MTAPEPTRVRTAADAMRAGRELVRRKGWRLDEITIARAVALVRPHLTPREERSA